MQPDEETDPPKVVRFIRTPGCTVVLEGNLEDTDRVYRLCSQGLMAGGYRLPSTEERTHSTPEPVPPIAELSHYQRELDRLKSEPIRVELIDTRRQQRMA